LECLLDNLPSPNGLVLNEHETDLLLAVTRANAVWRIRFLPGSGAVGKSGTFIQLSGGLAGPDGLALAEDGSLAVCHMGFGTVWLFSRLGEPLLRIKSPAGILTGNCAFGGPEGRTLFVTEAETASILTAELPVKGFPMFGQA
jgi:gluconolactonase